MKTTQLLFLILISLAFLKSNATSQVPDILLYKGDTLPLYSNPLEQHPSIESLRKKLFNKNNNTWSTACYREYIAEWILVDNQLYLSAIYDCLFNDNKVKADLQLLFGDSYVDGKVEANWVTEELIVPKGKLLKYFHTGYQSIYEQEIGFKIKAGKLDDIITYDNSKTRVSKYANLETLQDFIYRHIDWELIPLEATQTRMNILFSANDKGIIDSIQIKRGVNKLIDDDIIKIIKSIPSWEVYYRRGKHHRTHYPLTLNLSVEIKNKYCF